MDSRQQREVAVDATNVVEWLLSCPSAPPALGWATAEARVLKAVKAQDFMWRNLGRKVIDRLDAQMIAEIERVSGVRLVRRTPMEAARCANVEAAVVDMEAVHRALAAASAGRLFLCVERQAGRLMCTAFS